MIDGAGEWPKRTALDVVRGPHIDDPGRRSGEVVEASKGDFCQGLLGGCADAFGYWRIDRLASGAGQGAIQQVGR